MKKLICAVFLSIIPSLGFAADAYLPQFKEFSPREHRQVERRGGVLFIQFRDSFCPKCDGQMTALESSFEEFEDSSFLSGSLGMTVDLDIWLDDPFVRDLSIKVSPTFIVFRDGVEVGRFEKTPMPSQVYDILKKIEPSPSLEEDDETDF
jgi:thiol-disulfide isomerase/thioredoxin